MTKRQYKRITPQVIAEHKLLQAELGNGSAAVRQSDPMLIAPHIRANAIIKKDKELNGLQYIDNKLQQIGKQAINRVEELVDSDDEKVATRNAHYVLDQLKGKAVQKTESKSVVLNIEAVLD